MHLRALSGWVGRGGGRCYLVLVKGIEVVIQKRDDINLIVAAGFAANSGANVSMDSPGAVINAVNRLAASGKPVFASLDGPPTQNGIF